MKEYNLNKIKKLFTAKTSKRLNLFWLEKNIADSNDRINLIERLKLQKIISWKFYSINKSLVKKKLAKILNEWKTETKLNKNKEEIKINKKKEILTDTKLVKKEVKKIDPQNNQRKDKLNQELSKIDFVLDQLKFKIDQLEWEDTTKFKNEKKILNWFNNINNKRQILLKKEEDYKTQYWNKEIKVKKKIDLVKKIKQSKLKENKAKAINIELPINQKQDLLNNPETTQNKSAQIAKEKVENTIDVNLIKEEDLKLQNWDEQIELNKNIDDKTTDLIESNVNKEDKTMNLIEHNVNKEDKIETIKQLEDNKFKMEEKKIDIDNTLENNLKTTNQKTETENQTNTDLDIENLANQTDQTDQFNELSQEKKESIKKKPAANKNKELLIEIWIWLWIWVIWFAVIYFII